MGFRWLLDCSQVACGLRDHFATTVSYLWASCALSVAIVCQMFMPLYIIVMPYLRHFGSFVPKNRMRLIVRAIGRDKTIVPKVLHFHKKRECLFFALSIIILCYACCFSIIGCKLSQFLLWHFPMSL